MTNNHNMNTLYQDLTALVENASDWSFTSKDLTLEGKTYRIFDYHLTSWTSFQAPNALNCRGTMFDITDPQNPVLAALPPPKFFNFSEGGVDHTTDKYVADVMNKLDGSLISTYMHAGQVRLKTKGHLFSEQAFAAMQLLDANYSDMKKELQDLVNKGYTVNFEYTSPMNMIVVLYPKDELTVLSIRRHEDGQMFFGSDIAAHFQEYPHIIKNTVSFQNHSKGYAVSGRAIDKFVEEIMAQTEGEGVVAQIKSHDGTHNYLTKIKNTHYVSLHHAKSAVDSPTRLLECIIRGQVDDLRALLINNQQVLDLIDSMQAQVTPVFNKMIAITTEFVEKNGAMDRKDFAIKAKSETGQYFSLVMSLYLKREPEYINFALKYKKEMFANIDFSVEKEAAPADIDTAQKVIADKKKLKM